MKQHEQASQLNVSSSSSGAPASLIWGDYNFQNVFKKTLNTMKKGLTNLKQSLGLVGQTNDRAATTTTTTTVSSSGHRLTDSTTRNNQKQRTPPLNAYRPHVVDESQCGMCSLDLQSSLFSNNNNNNNNNAMDVKVLLLGGNSVGKSAMASQFIKGEFIDSYHPTIEDHFKKTLSVDGNSFLMHILDSSGSVTLIEDDNDESVSSQYTSSTSTLDDETRVSSNLNTIVSTNSSLPVGTEMSSSLSSLPLNRQSSFVNSPNNVQCLTSGTVSTELQLLSSSNNNNEINNNNTTTTNNNHNNNNNLNTSRESTCSEEVMQKCLRESIISHINPKPKNKRDSVNPEAIFASNVVIFLVYSISDHSSFESVVQKYEELKQLVIESQLIRYYKEQESAQSVRGKKGSSLRAFLSSSKRSFNYSFQPTIMLVGTKKDQDTSVKSLSDLNTCISSTGSSDMHGFYYGYGHSNSSCYDLPSSLPIYGPTSSCRRPSIYDQFEYSQCGTSEHKRQVTYEEGEQYQQCLGENCLFMEISCQNPLEVEQVFIQACRKVRSKTIELDNSEHAQAFRSKTIKKRPKMPTFVENKDLNP